MYCYNHGTEMVATCSDFEVVKRHDSGAMEEQPQRELSHAS